jgi:anti-sigma factor RsiW
MDCRQYEIQISRLFDGELDGASAESVRSHLDVCPECRLFHERVVSLDAGLRAVANSSPVPDFGPLVRTRLERLRQPWITRALVPQWAGVPLMAALVLIAVGLGHMAGKSMTQAISLSSSEETAEFLMLERGPSLSDVAMEIGSEEPRQ